MHDDQTEQPTGASGLPPIRDVVGGDLVQGDKVMGNKLVTLLVQMPRLVLVVVVLALLMIVGATAISAAGAWPGVRSSLEQAGILSPALEVAPEAAGETLILVLPFEVSSGATDTKIHREIARAIEEQRDRLKLERVRVEMLRAGGLPASDRNAAEALGQRYQATMIVWGGVDTGARVEVSFLHLKEPTFDAADVTISETERSQIANGPAYVTFVTKELPQQFSFLALFALGQSAYSRGVHELAIRIIEQAVKQLEGMKEIPEGSSAAYIRLGLLYHTFKDNPSKAEVEYNKVIDIDPENIYAYTNRGNARFQQGNLSGSMDDYNQAVKITKNIPTTLSNLSIIHSNRGAARMSQGDHLGAISDFNEAIRLDQKNTGAYANRASIRLQQKHYVGAIEDYSKVIYFYPRNVDAYLDRGVARLKGGDKIGAMSDFNRAIYLDPNNSSAYIHRGSLRLQQGDRTGARSDFEQAVVLEPEKTTSYLYFNRAVDRLLQGDLTGAETDYTESIRLNPKNIAAYIGRGVIRMQQDNPMGAIADYNEVIRLDPENEITYINRGMAYLLQDNSVAAIADFDEAIRLNPKNEVAYSNRGHARLQQDDQEGAIADYNQAILFNPKWADAYYNRGTVRLKQGDILGATADFYRARNLSSPNTPIYEEAAKSLRDLGITD